MYGLPGAVNPGKQSYSVGFLKKKPFIVYASGSNVIVLDKNLKLIQTIPSDSCGYPNHITTCVDCSGYGGKVAAAWHNAVAIYKPQVKVIVSDPVEEDFPFEWYQDQVINLTNSIHCIKWNAIGSQLLTSCTMLSLWEEVDSVSEPQPEVAWQNVWSKEVSLSPSMISYTTDGSLFATCSENDCLVKIWFQFPPDSKDDKGKNFLFVYINHPKPVKGFQWRATCPLLPPGYVPNVLMTYCEDNYCRIWSHKVAQEKKRYYKNLRFYLAGIIDSQADNLLRSTATVGDFPFIAHWLDNKCITFLQKASKAVKSYSQQASQYSSQASLTGTSVQSLQEISKRDSEDPSDEGSDLMEEAKIPANRSLSLLPTTNLGSRRSSLIPLADLFRRPSAPASATAETSATQDASGWLLVPSPIRSKMIGVGRYALPKHLFDQLVDTWRDSSDMVFAIHPITGSLLLWTVDGLDFPSYSARVVHISFTSCIPHVISPLIAQTLWSHIPTITFDGLYQLPDVDIDVGEMSIPIPTGEVNLPESFLPKSNTWFLGLITCHSHGSLNMWSVEQSTLSSNSSISGLIHMCAADGHHGIVQNVSAHPLLPVIATYSSHSFQGTLPADLASHELMIWQCDPPVASHSKPFLRLLATLSSTGSSLNHFVWFPISIMFDDLSASVPQATVLAVQQDTDLVILEVTLYDQMSATPGCQNVCKDILCTSMFGEKGVKVLYTIQDAFDLEKKVIFLHVFQASTIEGTEYKSHDYQCFYLTLLEGTTGSFQKQTTHLKMWSIECHCMRSQSTFEQKASILPATGSWMQASHIYANSNKSGSAVLKVVTQLVTNSTLPLPSGCTVTHAGAACDTSPANSSSFACGNDNQPSYLFSTACSNGTYVGWQCVAKPIADDPLKENVSRHKPTKDAAGDLQYIWTPFLSRSHGDLSKALIIDCVQDLPMFSLKDSTPCAMAVAHACRVAMVHDLVQQGTKDDADYKKELLVTVWECESTGGLSWNLEEHFKLESTKQHTSPNKQAVFIGWIPLHNGAFALATCIENILHIHSQTTQNFTPSESKLERKWMKLTQISLNLVSVTDVPSTIASPGYGILLYAVHNEIKILDLISLAVEDNVGSRYSSLLESIRKSSISCPQYHPSCITELLNAGRLTSAKKILLNLLKSLQSLNLELSEDQLEDSEDDITSPVGVSPLTWIDSLKAIDEQFTYELTIPPLSLTTLGLLSVDELNKAPHKEEDEDEQLDLFTEVDIDEYSFDLEMSCANVDDINLLTSDWHSSHSDRLQRILRHVKLPYLTTFQQVQLISLSQTLANTKTSITKGNVLSHHYQRHGSSSVYKEGMDECGFRYILAQTNCRFIHDMLVDDSTVSTVSLTSHDFIWAFHSDAELDLVSALPCLQMEKLTWHSLRETGIGWWLRNHETLTTVMEKLAKSLFSIRHEPLDAVLFYMAMKKQTLMKALFKTVKNSKMQEFFSRNFGEERWHKAALKNAFTLLTKQRFEEAAAFFLLGDSLPDAVEVCLHKLRDIQLAVVITRLYEGREGGPVYNKILSEVVCADPPSTKSPSFQPMKDCFLRSMAYWLLGDYSQSLETLLNDSSDNGICNSGAINPVVFHFYFYLRNHPILLKRKYEQPRSGKLHYSSSVGDDSLTSLERLLVFKTADYYISCGLPLLAVDVLSKIPTQEYPDEQHVYGSCLTKQEGSVGGDPSVDQHYSRGNDVSSGLLISQPTVAACNDKTEKFEVPHQQVNESDTKVPTTPPFESVPHSDNLEDDDFDWSKPVLLQADRMDSISDNLELSIDIKKTSDSESNSIESDLADDTAISTQVTTNLSYGVHALAKQARCRLSLTLLCSELDTLCDFKDISAVRKSLSSWINTEVKGLCSFCSNDLFNEANDTNCIVDSQNVIQKLFRYCQLNSLYTPSLLYVCHELLLRFQPALADRISSERLSSPLAVQSRSTDRKDSSSECINHPSQVPLLSATLLPLAHPCSLAKELRMLSQKLVDTLALVPSPPTEGLSFVALKKFQQLSQSLYDLAKLMSNLLFCTLTHPGSAQQTDFESSIQRSASFKADSHVDSPPTSAKRKSKKKVSFSFEPSLNLSVLKPNSQPSKWPGLLNWPSLLPSEEGKDPQGICVLLVECIVPVYLALLAYSWLRQNANLTLHLLKNQLSFQLWCDVCGGGYESKASSRGSTAKKSSKLMGKLTAGKKSKMFKSDSPEIVIDRSSDGFFIPPKVTLCDYLLPNVPTSAKRDEKDPPVTEDGVEVDESLEFGWLLANLGAVRHAQSAVHAFIGLAGIEIMELSSQSTYLSKCCKMLEHWQDGFVSALEVCKEYNPFLGKVDMSSNKGPSILKHKSLLDPKNSPFNTHGAQLPDAQRLWDFLLHEEVIREGTFIKYLFKGKKITDQLAGGVAQQVNCLLYKSKESEGSISTMCIGEGSLSCIAIATAKEIIELDTAEAWKSETYTEDLEATLMNETPTLHTKMSDEFVLVHSSPKTAPLDIPTGSSALRQNLVISTSSEATQVLSRPSPGVRRLCSHPVLPYYLAGDSDGNVVMYEFGNLNPLFSPTKKASGGSVSCIRYTPQGNKFAVSDVHGNLYMWQGSQNAKEPYTHIVCHSRGTNDFAFMASSSLISAAGEANENRNVRIFDTLLPSGRSSVVKEYVCHEAGASAIAYSSQHQCLISGGRKGFICVFDVRQHSLLHSVPAHHGPITSIIVNDTEKYFVTGSSDGVIKIWDLVTLEKKHSFSKESSRALRLFKGDSGIADMYLSFKNNLLFSVSGDGIVRCRSINVM